jgi:hypothetical protein
MLCMSTFRNDSGTADIHHYHTNDLYKLIFFFCFSLHYQQGRGPDLCFCLCQPAGSCERRSYLPSSASEVWDLEVTAFDLDGEGGCLHKWMVREAGACLDAGWMAGRPSQPACQASHVSPHLAAAHS